LIATNKFCFPASKTNGTGRLGCMDTILGTAAAAAAAAAIVVVVVVMLTLLLMVMTKEFEEHLFNDIRLSTTYNYFKKSLSLNN